MLIKWCSCALSRHQYLAFNPLFFGSLPLVIEPFPTLAPGFSGPEQPDTKSFMYSQHNLIWEVDSLVVIVQSLHNDTSFLFRASFVTAVSPWQNCQSLMLRSSPQGRKSCDLSGHPPLTWQRCAIIFPLAHRGWISLKWMSFCVGCTIEGWQFSTLLASTWTHSLGCDLSLLLISNLGKKNNSVAAVLEMWEMIKPESNFCIYIHIYTLYTFISNVY